MIAPATISTTTTTTSSILPSTANCQRPAYVVPTEDKGTNVPSTKVDSRKPVSALPICLTKIGCRRVRASRLAGVASGCLLSHAEPFNHRGHRGTRRKVEASHVCLLVVKSGSPLRVEVFIQTRLRPQTPRR